MPHNAKYFIETEDKHTLTITDIGDGQSVLNNITDVVKELYENNLLKGRRLFFYDHTGRLDEIMYDEKGKYRGIRI
jgi:hypothetical protein